MVTCGFFDSIDGDRKYSADDISNFFLKLISNGVFATPANEMQVTATSCMTVKISPGWGFINCKWIHNDADFYLTLDEPDMVLNRADRIVLRLDKNTRTIEIAVKKGTPGETAFAPALQRDETIWELSLAYIYVWAGHTEITQADIADERGNTDVCGWIKCLIDQIDTTNLFAQYDAAFWIWFNGIKDSFIPDIRERLETAEKLIYPYTFPNIDGNDTLNVLDANLIQNFVSDVGSGKYTNDATGWAKFAEEKGLPESDYPDANGDGIVNAKETALILEFSADAAVGKYDNSKAGWNIFMTKKIQSDTQTALQKISTELAILQNQFVPIVKLTQEAYDALEEVDENTLYVII
ncbi:MAG: hypothetical protein K2H89_01055 [Oscillospiraceae bacterium]|nr:hypothetical protein [Oscillospiraceae bacterium]